METAYTQALWEMVEKGMQPKKAVHALREVLVRQGRVSLLPRMGHAFVKLAERERARSEVVLSIARGKDERTAHKAVKKLLSDMEADSKDVTIQADETLIGGWRLEGKEQLVDASFKKQLLSIYNRTT